MNDHLKQLDQLIADLGGSRDPGKQSAGPSALLVEHLHTARRELLGAAHNQYRASLKEAKESLSFTSDKDGRAKAREVLESLMAPRSPRARLA